MVSSTPGAGRAIRKSTSGALSDRRTASHRSPSYAAHRQTALGQRQPCLGIVDGDDELEHRCLEVRELVTEKARDERPGEGAHVFVEGGFCARAGLRLIGPAGGEARHAYDRQVRPTRPKRALHGGIRGDQADARHDPDERRRGRDRRHRDRGGGSSPA